MSTLIVGPTAPSSWMNTSARPCTWTSPASSAVVSVVCVIVMLLMGAHPPAAVYWAPTDSVAVWVSLWVKVPFTDHPRDADSSMTGLITIGTGPIITVVAGMPLKVRVLVGESHASAALN